MWQLLPLPKVGNQPTLQQATAPTREEPIWTALLSKWHSCVRLRMCESFLHAYAHV